jgi:hypothetical protein
MRSFTTLLLATMLLLAPATSALAQDNLPWRDRAAADDAYRPPSTYGEGSVYRPVQRQPVQQAPVYEEDGSAGGASPGNDGAYRPRGSTDAYRGQSDNYRPDRSAPDAYSGPRESYQAPRDQYSEPPQRGGNQFGEPYAPPREDYGRRYEDDRYADERAPRRGTYSEGEILRAGHSFFGSVSQGLAQAVEYVFKQSGRPNGYILGEDAGDHPVFWQGPSLGYDFGAEGSKTMVLVYNLRDPSEIYNRFGGVQGSAYLIGGVSVQFQKYGNVVLAPIRSGLGLRLGANVGYLKYTRKPTWNPF